MSARTSNATVTAATDASTPPRLSARERLLNAADELFYDQGVHTVGIDKVIERAGVAKASLYTAFGSKDELIRAYLERRNSDRMDRYARELPRFKSPRDRLLGVFDVQGETFERTGFHGCAFINASAESPAGGVVEQVADTSRASIRTMFVDLAREAGVADPESLAEQLAMVYDGAVVTARMDRNPTAAKTARAVAVVLLDAALSA